MLDSLCTTKEILEYDINQGWIKSALDVIDLPENKYKYDLEIIQRFKDKLKEKQQELNAKPTDLNVLIAKRDSIKERLDSYTHNPSVYNKTKREYEYYVALVNTLEQQRV